MILIFKLWRFGNPEVRVMTRPHWCLSYLLVVCKEHVGSSLLSLISIMPMSLSLHYFSPHVTRVSQCG